MTPEDSLAMLLAMVGEDQLTSSQKSHILSRLDPSRAAAYHHLLDFSPDIAQSSNSSKAILSSSNAEDPDRTHVLQVSPLTSPASRKGPNSDLDSSEWLLDAEMWPLALTKDQPDSRISANCHDQAMGRVGSFEGATNKISAWESQHNSHDNILGEHSDSPLPTKMAKSINESVHLNGAPRLKMPPPTSCGSPIQQSKELTTTSACPAELSETLIADVIRPILAPRKVNQPKLPKRRMPTYGIWREFVPSENVWDDKDLSSSPEKGTTTEMFGLPLPTQKAREIAVRIGLAPDHINDQIHSHTKSRVKSKKRIKSSINFTFPSRNVKLLVGSLVFEVERSCQSMTLSLIFSLPRMKIMRSSFMITSPQRCLRSLDVVVPNVVNCSALAERGKGLRLRIEQLIRLHDQPFHNFRMVSNQPPESSRRQPRHQIVARRHLRLLQIPMGSLRILRTRRLF